jgi:hypothetical protein
LARSPGKLTPRYGEALLVALFMLVVGWQLFIRPQVGSADNGDFPKVAGRFCVAVPDETSRYRYFQPHYLHGKQYCWKSQVLSSENAIAALAVPVGVELSGGRKFDLRYLGALHAIFLVLAYWSFLRILRPLGPWRRWILSVVAFFIFADTYVVAYMSSFYSDTAALLGLLLAVPLAIWAMREPSRILPVALCGLSGLLVVMSKGQHAVGAGLLIPAAFAFAATNRFPRVRIAAAFAGILLTGGALWSLVGTPRDYSAIALFNVEFFKVVKGAANPVEAVVELGLAPSEARYSGMHAFVPGGPMEDPAWRNALPSRTNFGRVLRYYLRHPAETGFILENTLREDAPGMLSFAHYQIKDASSPYESATKFAVWSLSRIKLLIRWPWHIALWLGAVIVGSIVRLSRGGSPRASRPEWLCLVVASTAVNEFFISALADGPETFRHLFLFHIAADITVLFAAAAALDWANSRFGGRLMQIAHKPAEMAPSSSRSL